MQLESIDQELKNKLWNLFDLYYLTEQKHASDYRGSSDEEFGRLLIAVWNDFYKLPIDSISSVDHYNFEFMRKWFFAAKWNELFDFIEFVAETHRNKPRNNEFKAGCNRVLEEESSGYRFVSGQITEITSKTEIEEIEKAQESPLSPMNNHFERSLALLTDKKNPDYRNSIKESVLGLETLFKVITGRPDSTLGDALKSADPGWDVHPALLKAYSSLYGYSSTSEGIRHALLDKDKVTREDAQYFLVVCSAFANYVLSKAARAGVKFEEQ